MIQPINNKAYKLLHDGVIALAQVEGNGIKIDVDYLQQAIIGTTNKIGSIEDKLRKSKVFKAWRKRYGQKTNLDSSLQLGEVLFSVLGYDCPQRTSTGKPKTDEAVLETLDIPFVVNYLQAKKLKKAKSTYLQGILRETCNGFLHPVFNLHFAQTYRSTSDSPNFQNMPIRNPEMGKLIRQCFIPRSSSRHIVEVDYGGIEVHAASWYHKDPRMLSYIKDKSKDMHRDMAQQCYSLPKAEMLNPVDSADAKRIKNIRYCGKNKFVFPQFYGDWFYSCAPFLWQALDQMQLTMRDGSTVKEHLASCGITKLGSTKKQKDESGKWHYPTPKPGTFIHHIKQVEEDFWSRRFKVYKQWKEEWYNHYLNTGKFEMLTGFRVEGIYKRNEVINYPVQGVAFHCLLWSLIRISKLLKKYKMRSLLIGQIHDSIVGDVVGKELKNYLEIVNQVMCVDIKKHWHFIITPIEIEVEVAPLGKSWYEKQAYKL